MDRYRVAALAAEQFDTERIVATVLGALGNAAGQKEGEREDD